LIAADNVKTIGTRTFVWSDNIWLESDITNGELVDAELVEYMSDEYFALSRADAETSKILALGAEVIFRSGKKVMRVIEAKEEAKVPEGK